jgi:hypothetical protein
MCKILESFNEIKSVYCLPAYVSKFYFFLGLYTFEKIVM